MKIYSETSIRDFKAWSGAIDTLERVINAGKADELEAVLEDLYPDGLDETELNDILWFDSDWVYEVCGMQTDEEIEEERDEIRSELAELQEKYDEECKELREENPDLTFGELEAMRDKLWTDNYAEDYAELIEKMEELENL